MRVGRAIYYYKPLREDFAEYERMLGRVEKIKDAFPKLWKLVIKEEPEPLSWGV